MIVITSNEIIALVQAGYSKADIDLMLQEPQPAPDPQPEPDPVPDSETEQPVDPPQDPGEDRITRIEKSIEALTALIQKQNIGSRGVDSSGGLSGVEALGSLMKKG